MLNIDIALNIGKQLCSITQEPPVDVSNGLIKPLTKSHNVRTSRDKKVRHFITSETKQRLLAFKLVLFKTVKSLLQENWKDGEYGSSNSRRETRIIQSSCFRDVLWGQAALRLQTEREM